MTAPSSDTMSAAEFFRQDDNALAQAILGEPKQPVEEAPAKEPVSAPTVKPPASAPEPKVEETPTDTVTQEGAEPKVDEGQEPERKPMTQFKMYDPDGELEIPLDVEIELKGNGKVHRLPLDHVVRLAQFGFSNKEREEQVQAAKHFVAEAQQKEVQFQQTVQNYEGNIERLLNDPIYYEEVRQRYLQENTPDARATRAETALAQERSRQAETYAQQTVQGFVQSVLVPTTERLLQEHNTVTEAELIGQYTKMTAPLLVNGRVPLNRLQAVQQMVERDLTEWVQATHLERQSERRRVEQSANKATRDAAVAKRAIAQKLATPGASPGINQQQAPRKYDSANDWLKSTFGGDDQE